MNMRDNLLATAAMRAAYMEEDGFITLPDGTAGEDEVAQFCADLADEYIATKPADPFDIFIEEKFAEKYGEDKKSTVPSPVMHEANHPKHITLTVTGKLARPQDVCDLTLRERLVWEAQFGETGKYYVFLADAGDAFLLIPRGTESTGADASLDNAWLWYDAGSLLDFLNDTWGEAITPEYLRSLFAVPELMAPEVYEALMNAIKEAK